MNGDVLQGIGVFGQLGIGGLLVFVVFLTRRQMELWFAAQQARDDARDRAMKEKDAELIAMVMTAQTEQTQAVRETARLLNQTAVELRVVTDRLGRALEGRPA